jgi:hypothetical protein
VELFLMGRKYGTVSEVRDKNRQSTLACSLK